MVDGDKGRPARLYMSVMNELYVKASIVQVAIILVYCATRFISYMVFHSELQSEFNEKVFATKQTSLTVQQSNLVAQHQDQIDFLQFYGLIMKVSLQTSAPDGMAPVDRIDKMTADSAYYVDGSPSLGYADLSSTKKTAIASLLGVLDVTSGHIQREKGTRWIKAVAVTHSVEADYLTVMKILPGSGTNTSDIFKYASSCHKNKVCLANCWKENRFSFECLTSHRGPMLSPLRLHSDSVLNSNTFLYTVEGSSSYKFIFFYSMDTEKTTRAVLASGSRAAIFSGQNSPSGSESISLGSIVQRRKDQSSLYRLDPEEDGYQDFLNKTFKVITPRKLELSSPHPTFSPESKSLDTLWGIWVLSAIGQLHDAFFFTDTRSLVSLQKQDSIQFVILLGIFSLNIAFIHW